MADSEKKLVEALVTANRILANERIIDVFGHVSVRSERNTKEFLLSCSRAPNSVKAHSTTLLTTSPLNPTIRNLTKFSLPAIRSRNRPRKNLTVSLSEALLSPALR